jgi:hypothetical protein
MPHWPSPEGGGPHLVQVLVRATFGHWPLTGSGATLALEMRPVQQGRMLFSETISPSAAQFREEELAAEEREDALELPPGHWQVSGLHGCPPHWGANVTSRGSHCSPGSSRPLPQRPPWEEELAATEMAEEREDALELPRGQSCRQLQ